MKSLVPLAAVVGILALIMMWQVMQVAADAAREHFSSWEEYGRSFAMGRGVWHGDEEDCQTAWEIVTTLHEEEPSPWQQPVNAETMERGLEFYVMLAAVAGGALTWLYRKGSRVWRTVRKLHRSFREICLNPKSTLDNERCRQLAVGAMYASQQGAWQNSLETGIFDTLPEILGGWWGIASPAEARAQLDYLCEKGFRYYRPTVLEAFRLDGRERQDELLQQRMTSQEDYDKVSSQLENLRETFDELLSCGVVASKEDLIGCNVTGWDAGRIVFLARACCEMGYLSEEEVWRYIGRADALAHETCGSWRELAMSYILGRSLWGGKRAYNSVMKTTADVLLNDLKSPWVRYPW